VGRQDAPATTASPTSQLARPVAFTTSIEAPAPTPLTKSAIQPSPVSTSGPARSVPPDQIARPDTKRKIEAALTAAAIAAIIVQASRDQYHATGRPCACPDDSMRNGRACGGRSAYSRPGGASPLCYPSDVTAAMIDSYRQRQASR
jgi:hypothetical protein